MVTIGGEGLRGVLQSDFVFVEMALDTILLLANNAGIMLQTKAVPWGGVHSGCMPLLICKSILLIWGQI